MGKLDSDISQAWTGGMLFPDHPQLFKFQESNFSYAVTRALPFARRALGTCGSIPTPAAVSFAASIHFFRVPIELVLINQDE
jgi:hypothetical protein